MKQNLSTLSVLHYVYGALLCLGGLFMLSLVGLGSFLNSDWLQQNADGEPPPAFVGGFLAALGWVMFVLIEAWGVLNIISGRNLGRLRGRTLSMVVAGFNLLSVPLGTALGVFTLIALSDEEVRSAYHAGKAIV